jgi:hypothetical protein
MSGSTILISATVVVFALLVWLLIPGRKTSPPAGSSLQAQMNDALAAPRHYLYFAQIRQALSGADARYLLEFAPPHVAKQALRERRAVARRFLRGLHEDFSNLARLGRIVAALSPEVSHRQETERLMLNVKFQLLYGLVWLRLSTGNLPLQRLEHLTGLVGRFAKRMDEAMAEISALSAGNVPGNLRA